MENNETLHVEIAELQKMEEICYTIIYFLRYNSKLQKIYERRESAFTLNLIKINVYKDVIVSGTTLKYSAKITLIQGQNLSEDSSKI